MEDLLVLHLVDHEEVEEVLVLVPEEVAAVEVEEDLEDTLDPDLDLVPILDLHRVSMRSKRTATALRIRNRHRVNSRNTL